MKDSILISVLFMLLGICCFVFLPTQMMRLFSKSELVLEIGRTAFPIIGSSFIMAVFSLMMPVFFQAIGNGFLSLLLSLIRQIFCLVPVFWLLSKIGLNCAWIAFPVAETVSGAIGIVLYRRQTSKWKREEDELS